MRFPHRFVSCSATSFFSAAIRSSLHASKTVLLRHRRQCWDLGLAFARIRYHCEDEVSFCAS